MIYAIQGQLKLLLKKFEDEIERKMKLKKKKKGENRKEGGAKLKKREKKEPNLIKLGCKRV
jgi:hypothetical protein